MTEANDLFIKASRAKFRFASSRGDLTVEDLWDLPLTSTRGPSLDEVARTVNNKLKSVTEDSFVATNTNPNRRVFEQSLEIVKFVISVRQDENTKKLEAVALAERRTKLREALARQEDASILSKSREDLLAELEEIDGKVAAAA